MGPLALALIGAGIGALKSEEEKNMWADQQRAEAEKTRYGAWTGQWGKNVPQPSYLSNIMGGATSGFLIGKGADGTNDGTSLADDDSITDGDVASTDIGSGYVPGKFDATGPNQSNMSGAATGDDFGDYLKRTDGSLWRDQAKGEVGEGYSGDQFIEWLKEMKSNSSYK